MKKIFAILLAAAMLFSMATIASAAGSTTTLTTRVPSAIYILNIPADQEIVFGATKTDIGCVTVTASEGFAKGKNLKVTATYDPFTSADASTTIPFALKCPYGIEDYYTYNWTSGRTITFYGSANGTVDEHARMLNNDGSIGSTIDKINVVITSEDWGKALAGEYTATITFNAEVVVE